MTITPQEATVAVGNTFTFNATVIVTPDDDDLGLPAGYRASQGVTWGTDDSSIAAVDGSGTVTGVSVGATSVSAVSTFGDHEADARITVVAVPTPAPTPGGNNGGTIMPDQRGANIPKTGDGSLALVAPVVGVALGLAALGAVLVRSRATRRG